mgnify:CR=1 FL=1
MLTKVIEQSKIDHFTKWFDRADKIVIVSHVGPDGDAIGSSLGLWHFFSSQGKTANVIVPNAFPDFLKWMPGKQGRPSVRPLQGVCRQADCRGGCHLLSGL